MDIRCKFCNSSKDEEELIETQGSLLLLKPGVVDFSDILSEVFGNSKADHLSHICFDCKEQIVAFYKFKVKVKPNLHNLDEEKEKIVGQVRDFLAVRNEIPLTVIQESENSISIVPSFVEESSYTQQSVAFNDIKTESNENSFKVRNTIQLQVNNAVNIKSGNLSSIIPGSLKRKRVIPVTNNLSKHLK